MGSIKKMTKLQELTLEAIFDNVLQFIILHEYDYSVFRIPFKQFVPKMKKIVIDFESADT